jgi:hypothetical protein
MVVEKLGKAYFWRGGSPPPRSHSMFVQFMRSLGSVRRSERLKLASALDFARFEDFRYWLRRVLPLAHAVERLAPDLAQDGPNPEYPWPANAPEFIPATFEFDVWRQLTETAHGRQLNNMIKLAVERFPAYA